MKCLNLTHEREGAFEMERYTTTFACPTLEEYKRYVLIYTQIALLRQVDNINGFTKYTEHQQSELDKLELNLDNVKRISYLKESIDDEKKRIKCVEETISELLIIKKMLEDENSKYETIKEALDQFDETDDEDFDWKIAFYRLDWVDADNDDEEFLKGIDNGWMYNNQDLNAKLAPYLV